MSGLPKLTAKARELILETIKFDRLCGSRDVAAATEMLLVLHDRIHGLADDSLKSR